MVYGCALDRGVLQTSPVERIRPRVLAPRDRVATEQELGIIWRALSDIVAAGESLPERLPGQSHRQRTGTNKPPSNRVASTRTLQLSILTLQRRGEIAGIHERDIDWDQRVWTIPALNNKERRIGKTPLSAQALTVLREAFAAASLYTLAPSPSMRKCYRGDCVKGPAAGCLSYNDNPTIGPPLDSVLALK